MTGLTRTETKNEYNKTGRNGVCEGVEWGVRGGALLSLNLIYPAVVPKLNCTEHFSAYACFFFNLQFYVLQDK